MKEKEILEVIREDISSRVPNVLSKISLQEIEIDEPTEVKKQKRKFAWPKLFTFANAFILAGAVVLTVVAISLSNTPPPTGPVTSFLQENNTKQKNYVMAATSGIGLAEAFNSPTIKMRTDKLFTGYINEVNPYINMAERILGNRGEITATVAKNTSSDSVLKDYEWVLTYEDNTLKTTYQMYYNEKFKDQSKKNLERELSGYLVGDSTQLYFEATEEIKISSDISKNETELEMKIYLNTDKKSYITINEELEKEEYEFSYEVYENGKKILEIEMEIETKKETKELVLEYQKLVDGKEVKYEVDVKVVDGNYIGEYQIDSENNEKLQGKLEITVGLTSYTYLLTDKETLETKTFEGLKK